MKKHIAAPRTVLFLACALLLAQAGLASAADVRLLPVQAGDLAAGALGQSELLAPADRATKGMIPDTPREAVRFAFPLDADATIETLARPYQARSLEYFVEVDAEALRQGVELFTTAPEALIRLNPAAAAQKQGRARTMSVDPSSIVIARGERAFADGSGMALLANADQLKATGAAFADGTVAFRLAPEVGAGTLRLAVPGLEAEGRYAVHVFDRNSDVALGLAADATDVFHGDTLRVRATLPGASLEAVEGFVTSPAGRAWPVELRADGETFVAELSVDAMADLGQGPPRGLWEVHVAARGRAGEKTVMRSARTSFAAHLPTAGLRGDVAVERSREGLRLGFGVDVAAAGRYEVRGVLFGTNRASGELVPVAAVHAADWLETSGTLSLELDRELLRASGTVAPFELRDLRLLDQGRMGVLHRQAVALRVGLEK